MNGQTPEQKRIAELEQSLAVCLTWSEAYARMSGIDVPQHNGPLSQAIRDARAVLYAPSKPQHFEATPEVLAAIKAVESAHFRTNEDTGANQRASLVWSALRRQFGLPMIARDDLPAWDEARGGYYMPEKSKLLTAPEALARGGRV